MGENCQPPPLGVIRSDLDALTMARSYFMTDQHRSTTSQQQTPSTDSDTGQWSRRKFLNTAASVGALAMGASSVTAQSKHGPRSKYGATVSPKPGRRVLGSNDRIQLGIIGSGGMGRYHINSILHNTSDVEFIAVCDIYEGSRKAAIEGFEHPNGKPKAFVEHEKLLEMKEIDGVVVGSPDHWHERHLIDSVMAGKDVYCEKPMSWSIAQGANMVEQVRRTDRIVQVGMQRRSTESIMEAKKIIDSGFLGEVSLVRAHWYWNMPNLPKPDEVKLQGDLDWGRFQLPLPPEKRYPLNPVKYLAWRYFWEYSGGNMTDQGTHLMDVIQWMMNDSKPPIAAQEHGDVYQLDGYETPDTFCAVFEYPKFMATWTLTYTNNWHDAWAIVFQGREGTLELDDAGARFYKEKWPHDWETNPPKPVHEIKGGPDVAAHEKNFFHCMRTREEPNCPVEIGHQAVSALHLANAAHHAKRRAILGKDGKTIRF
jgi:predicted dehydrogenase